MGYQCLYPQELMFDIANYAFVDARTSFGSLIPATLPRADSKRLVSAWLERLKKHPELQDKIEFDVVQSCYVPELFSVLDERYPGLLDAPAKAAWGRGLKQIGVAAIQQHEDSGFPLAHTMLDGIGAKWAELKSGDHQQPPDALFDDLKKGGFAFSIFARFAFMAEQWIRSLVDNDALEPTRSDDLRHSLGTVTHQFINTTALLTQGSISKEDWLLEYGYMRPGNFDIRSVPLITQKDLPPFQCDHRPGLGFEFHLSSSEKRKIDLLLDSCSFPAKADQLITFIRTSISNREQCKFAFGRLLSLWLEQQAGAWEDRELTRDDLSWLSVEDLLPEFKSHDQATLEDKITRNRSTWQANQGVHLNDVIFSPEQVFSFCTTATRPNFLGRGVHRGPVRCLSPDNIHQADINNKMICIEHADPGWDWIFTRPIAGLVTMWGGPNSHMAIRCAEMNLPAVLGCGERLFNSLANSANIQIDCDSKLIQSLP